MVPQRLLLDFVAPPAAPGLRRVLLAIGAVVAVAAAAQFYVVAREYRAQKAELAAATQRAAVPVDAPRRSTPVPGLQSAGNVARDLTAPWADLLRAIEAIQNKDVALHVIEPVAARQSLRITADARSLDAMLDYLQQLQAWAMQDVTLVSHQVQPQHPGMPIRFVVQARWGNGAAAKRPPAGAVIGPMQPGDAVGLAGGSR